MKSLEPSPHLRFRDFFLCSPLVVGEEDKQSLPPWWGGRQIVLPCGGRRINRILLSPGEDEKNNLLPTGEENDEISGTQSPPTFWGIF